MTHPDRRRAGRRIRKTRRAYVRLGLSLEAAGKAAHRAARSMVRVGQAFSDPSYPTINELNSMTPLTSVRWAGWSWDSAIW